MKTSKSKAKLKERHSEVCGNPQALCCPLTLGLSACVIHLPSPGLTLSSTWGRQRKGSQTGSCLSAGLLI